MKLVSKTEIEDLNQAPESESGQANTKILITGANGYIGSNLRIFLKRSKYDVYGFTSKGVPGEKIYHLDMTDRQKIFDALNFVNPDVIVHTAALSSLNECERNPELARKINVETTRNLISSIRESGTNVKFVFLSSDYVFDGQCGNYKEEDDVNPQTVYGKTKAQSEVDIKERLENFVICRTANVFCRGGNFFSFVLDALEKNNSVEVFDDAFFTPTYIDYLLDSLRSFIELDFKGVIHVAGRERLSRYDFALKMAETLCKDASLVKRIKKGQLVAKDSSLNCEYSRKVLQNLWPSLDESLHYCFGNLVPPYFYHIDNRGKLLGIFQGLEWQEINYIESIKGSIRGNHYHKETREGFFLIDGKIRVTIFDMSKNSKRTFVAKKGDAMVINPSITHTFEMLEDSKWINMLSKPFDGRRKDIHINWSEADQKVR
jgi:dTDP-4-dehydrorhamnose reductase